MYLKSPFTNEGAIAVKAFVAPPIIFLVANERLAIGRKKQSRCRHPRWEVLKVRDGFGRANKDSLLER